MSGSSRDLHRLRRWLYPLLLPLSWVYVAGLRMYLLPYSLRIRKQHKLFCPVVCIGNLTFGGTGKTPAVITVARELSRRGLKVAVLSRGHGGRLSSEGAVVSDGKRKLPTEDSGDEPALIADALDGVPVVIGKNRVKMGQLAIKQFQPDILLMDDGMQYWQVHKDVIVALMNAREPFGEGGVLPAGTLREPVSGLKRASSVVITGVDALTQEQLDGVMRKIARINKSLPVYTARHRPDNLYAIGEKKPLPLGYLNSREVAALSAIGSPESFEATLESLGALVVERLRYPDHHVFDEWDLLRIRSLSEKIDVVTTEKDALRLPSDLAAKVLVLGVSLEINGVEQLTKLICEKNRV